MATHALLLMRRHQKNARTRTAAAGCDAPHAQLKRRRMRYKSCIFGNWVSPSKELECDSITVRDPLSLICSINSVSDGDTRPPQCALNASRVVSRVARVQSDLSVFGQLHKLPATRVTNYWPSALKISGHARQPPTHNLPEHRLQN